MKKTVKIALAMYVIVMLGCVFAFVMQKSVTYEHINFAREKIIAAMGTDPNMVQSVDYNRYLAEASIAMGHEIEEHLLNAVHFYGYGLHIFAVLLGDGNVLRTGSVSQ